MESKAQHAARGVGLRAFDNLGRFMLIDPDRNVIVAGAELDP